MKKRLGEYLERMAAQWGVKLSRAPKAGGPRRELHLVLDLEDGTRLTVGRLHHDLGAFIFEYDDEFKAKALPAIPGFPDLGARYESPVLWPFFQVRIPPLSREDVAREVLQQQIDPSDIFQVLGTLGQRTLTSPYILQPAH